jgi:hypothetical protein
VDDPRKRRRIVMNNLVRTFAEANPDTPSRITGGRHRLHPRRWRRQPFSGTAPDVVSVRRTCGGPFARKNVLTPLTPDGPNQVGIRRGISSRCPTPASGIRQHRRLEAVRILLGRRRFTADGSGRHERWSAPTNRGSGRGCSCAASAVVALGTTQLRDTQAAYRALRMRYGVRPRAI